MVLGDEDGSCFTVGVDAEASAEETIVNSCLTSTALPEGPYSCCIAALGGNSAILFLFARPFGAWPASFARLRFDEVAVVAVVVGSVARHRNPEGQRRNQIVSRHVHVVWSDGVKHCWSVGLTTCNQYKGWSACDSQDIPSGYPRFMDGIDSRRLPPNDRPGPPNSFPLLVRSSIALSTSSICDMNAVGSLLAEDVAPERVGGTCCSHEA